jgi:hypothetical protein
MPQATLIESPDWAAQLRGSHAWSNGTQPSQQHLNPTTHVVAPQ